MNKSCDIFSCNHITGYYTNGCNNIPTRVVSELCVVEHKKDKVEKLDIPSAAAAATAVKYQKIRCNELCRFRRHPVFSHA